MSIEIKGMEEIKDTLVQLQELGKNPQKMLEEYVVVPIYNEVIKA